MTQATETGAINRALPIHLLRHFCCRMYRLATMHSVTDRQTDDIMTPIADQTVGLPLQRHLHETVYLTMSVIAKVTEEANDKDNFKFSTSEFTKICHFEITKQKNCPFPDLSLVERGTPHTAPPSALRPPQL